MKRLALLVIAMIGLFFTSCKPEPENGENNGGGNGEAGKVKVSCTIPINKGTRSDFSGLFEDGVINWGDGRECVYLAVHGDNPKIVELEGYCYGYKPVVEFIAYVDENLLTAGESYDIWYFGHSQQLDSAYVSLVDGNKIEGSIAKQTGRLEDLGYSHIASTSVTAVMENGEVKLPLVGTLKNRMAIALLDLTDVTKLYGSSVNTDYTLEYNVETGRFEFNVIEDEDASIEVESAVGISYVALLPNKNNKVELRYKKYAEFENVFYNGIKENKIYYRLDENENIGALVWNPRPDYTIVNGYEFVDLGLSSGIRWAFYNVEATSPEESGKYYYGSTNVTTWGSGCRKPTKEEIQELIDECTWVWTTIVNKYGKELGGYRVVGPNNNEIFILAAGYDTKTTLGVQQYGIKGYYWTSTYFDGSMGGRYYYCLGFGESNVSVTTEDDFANPIRFVIDK